MSEQRCYDVVSTSIQLRSNVIDRLLELTKFLSEEIFCQIKFLPKYRAVDAHLKVEGPYFSDEGGPTLVGSDAPEFFLPF